MGFWETMTAGTVIG